MAVLDLGDGGAPRGGTAVERYVRELLRDAERMRRSSPPAGRSDGAAAPEERSPVKPLLRPSPEPATDAHRPVV